jgi:UDP-glucose 4-epimerase
VFASSIAVYGKGQLPMSEEMVPQPEDPYGISKYAVELDLKAAHEMFGIDHIVFRPHNVYGERQNIADKYRNVIGIFMNQLLQGQPMTAFGDGLQTRAFSHVDDVAPIIARAPLVKQAYNRVFNIGADTPYTILQLAEEIALAFGKPVNVKHLPARNEVVHAFSDHSRVMKTFDPPAPIDLRTGIRRMAAWVKSRGPATPVRFSDIEVRDKLPAGWES